MFFKGHNRKDAKNQSAAGLLETPTWAAPDVPGKGCPPRGRGAWSVQAGPWTRTQVSRPCFWSSPANLTRSPELASKGHQTLWVRQIALSSCLSGTPPRKETAPETAG